MRISLVCDDLDEGFIFDNVGCEVASVDAPSIDPNRSFTLKHPRAGGMTVYNEGTTAPGVCPRSGVGRIGALGGFAFFVDNLDVRNQVAALCLPWLIGQETAMHDHCIDLRILEKFRHRLEILPVVCGELFDRGLVIVLEQARLVLFPCTEKA